MVKHMPILTSLPGGPASLQGSQDFVDLRDILMAFRRRLVPFVITFITVVAAVIFGTLNATPQYTSMASVMMDFRDKAQPDFTSVLSGLAPDASLVDTEVESIRSRNLAEKVVRGLNLTADPEFNGTLREVKGFAKLKGDITGSIKKSVGLEESKVEIISADVIEDGVVSAVISRLGVGRKGLTYVIDISFRSEDPEKATLIANRFAQQYLTEQLDAKFDATSRVNGWLTGRLEDLRTDLRQAENAVEAYRAQTGLLSAEGSSLTEQQISDINAQLIVQRAEFSESTARLNSVRRQIDSGATADSIAEVLSSTVISDLRREQAQIAGRKAELSTRYGERHPEISKVDQELADIDRLLDREISRIVSSLETENEINRQRVISLESALSRMKGQLDGNNRSLVRLRELEREAQGSQNLYNSFLERFKMTDGQDGIIEADARIVSKATLPFSQSSPKLKFNLLLAFVLGSLLGVATVVAAEIFDNGLASAKEVETDIGVPFLAFVPKVNAGFRGTLRRWFRMADKPYDYIVDKPFSSYAESYRTVRTSIQLGKIEGKPLQLIAFVSPNSGDGKTTSSLSLARLSSMAGTKTIVIDCDTRRRGLSQSVLATRQHDFALFLQSEEKELADYIERDELTDTDIITLSMGESSPRDLFGSKKFLDVLQALRKTYDLILLDTPPVLPVAETRILANLADGVILTTRWRRTKKDAVILAHQILVDARANILGLIMTQAKLNQHYAVGSYAFDHSVYRKYYTN